MVQNRLFTCAVPSGGHLQVQEGPGRVTRFHRTRQSLRRLRADRTGATMIEYALIASLIALALVSSVDRIGGQQRAMVQQAVDGFDRPASGD